MNGNKQKGTKFHAAFVYFAILPLKKKEDWTKFWEGLETLLRGKLWAAYNE